MTDKTRAAKGGEKGLNGEFYQGGQFLPSSETTVKGEQTRADRQAKPSKQEIAPYKWEVSERQSIWRKIYGACIFNRTGYSKENGAEGTLELNENFTKAMNWTQEGIDETLELIEKWNAGERWI